MEDYIESDGDLVLMEFGEAINPVTRQKLKILTEGRALFEESEIIYKNGCIGSEDCSERVSNKLKKIAETFGAEYFE